MPADPSAVPAEFVRMLSKVAEIPEDRISLDAALKTDLAVDSLALVELFTVAETHWGITIPDEEAQQLATVEQVVDYIQRSI